MNHDIRYKGLSFTPDDLATPHGSLSLAANAEIRDGAVSPAILTGTQIPPLLFNGNVATLKFIHHTSDGTRFIAIRPAPRNGTPSIHWFDNNGTHKGYFSLSVSNINDCQIEAIGNTLVIVAVEGVFYALWKDATYTLLGQKPPFPVIQFSLNRDTDDDKNTDDHEVSVDGDKGILIGSKADRRDIKEEYRTTVTDQVMAKINHRIDKITDLGCFYAPFLIRYALRLYDGTSLILHSPPVLLFPLLQRPVMTAIYKGRTKQDGVIKFNNSTKSYKYFIYLRRAILNFKSFMTQTQIEELQRWADIVKSIDIFITPQFSRIDDSKTINSVSTTFSETNKSLLGGIYQSTPQDFTTTYPNDTNNDNQVSFDLPECSEAELFDKIRNASSFFLLASLDINTVVSATSFQRLPFQPATLRHITTQQQMTDDYKSHNLLLPVGAAAQRHAHIYNHRLHLYGMAEQPFEGFPPEVLFPYCSSGENVSSVTVALKTNEGIQYLNTPRVDSSTRVHDDLLMHGYKFYPDTRAVEMHFQTSFHYKCKLRPHNGLNGAFALLSDINFSEASIAYGESFPTSEYVSPLPLLNKMYQSDVNNPFVFPPSNIYTVGMGTVLAMVPATRALTQGEFGKFPLIAFSSDGIWALEVTSDGTYLPPKSIDREVCTNPSSICQLDQQIVFATKRGLSILREQNSIPISEQLDGTAPDIATLFPQLANFFADAQGDNATTLANKAKMRLLIANSVHPVSFFQTADVLYDFANQRLIVTPPPVAASGNIVAFVYSLNDQAWSTMTIPVIKATLAAYPHPYIQFADGSLLCLDTPNSQAVPSVAVSQQPVLFITRPLSFGDGMYSVDGIIHNIHFVSSPNWGERGRLFLFGSNDLTHWHYIGRTNQQHVNYLPSHAYRYFRLAVSTLLAPPDRYISTSLNIKEKLPKL